LIVTPIAFETTGEAAKNNNRSKEPGYCKYVVQYSKEAIAAAELNSMQGACLRLFLKIYGRQGRLLKAFFRLVTVQLQGSQSQDFT